MRRKAVLLTVVLSLSGGSAQAMGLLDAWELALRNDAPLRAAGFERDAGQEEVAIGRAGLLPSLQYTYGANYSHSKVTQRDRTLNNTTKRDYDNYVSTLTLRQPLLDYAAWARYQQGVTRKLMADQRFRDRSQDLMVRLYQSWSEALLAQEKLMLLDAQRRAYQEQLALNRRLLAAGEGTQTDLRETEARYTVTEAQRIEQEDTLDAAMTDLENMMGSPLQIQDLSPLALDTLPDNVTENRSLSQWRELTVRHNAKLAVQRENVDYSRYEIERNRAGHLPTLDLVASTRNSLSESEYNYNQKYDTQTVGLQVRVPLYSGGAVSASMRQAAAEYQQSQAELDNQTRQTFAELRRQFNLCANGAAKIRAWQMSVAAAEEAIRATRQSVAGGERINLDVLMAEQEWYNARRELTEVKYRWLQAWLNLRYTAGTLNEQDMMQLAAWFQSAPVINKTGINKTGINAATGNKTN
ncbi:TolC family outer membrane protein [Dickeya dadantii]|uniref:TolC family outer membrane protein n=1 Tax=Dickeya dadantii TaxID=204038 RepID=UPI0003A9B211|nr:TolC family outer membrane protein [Dickeya dadantii]NPE58079.1 TolC family outer membrane protein [Dickeya dadantii]NPE69246.1 TolC family outer membrane protein [Dickeya dadantii]